MGRHGGGDEAPLLRAVKKELRFWQTLLDRKLGSDGYNRLPAAVRNSEGTFACPMCIFRTFAKRQKLGDHTRNRHCGEPYRTSSLKQQRLLRVLWNFTLLEDRSSSVLGGDHGAGQRGTAFRRGER